MLLNKSLYFYIVVASLLLFFNSFTLTNNINLVISLPQVFIVIYSIFRGNLSEAVIFHFLFFLTSISPTAGLNLGDDIVNYSRLKLFGDVAVHQALSALLAILSYNKRQTVKLPFFDLSFKILFYLAFVATCFGILGLFFADYQFKYFIPRFVYIVTVLVNMYILKKNVDHIFLKSAVLISISLLIVTPIISFITFNLGITVSYSVFDVPVFSDVIFFVPILFLAFFYIKNIIHILLPLLFYFVLLIQVGRGGFFLITIFSLIVLCWHVFVNKQYFRKYRARVISLRFIFIILIVSFLGGYLSLSVEGLAEQKMGNLMSLINFISGSEIEDIDHSPYIRIAEFLNIINEENFFLLIFGKGYGGYFIDNLNLFQNVDLYRGAFSDEVILSGQYTSAHSVYPNALLYNGLIGLFLILYLGIGSIKKTKNSFLAFGGVILFFYSLYFNHLMGSIAIFFLFASELNLNNKENTYENIIH